MTPRLHGNPTQVPTIYTTGHSTHPIDAFLALLRQHGISTLADVRSRPYSKWAPHFQKNPLSRSTREAGIDYIFLGGELGGRPDAGEFYDADGHVDYARRAQAPDFKSGIERLVGLGTSRETAFMCAEEDPTRCHRRLLVTPALEQQGIEVVHIRGTGELQPEVVLRAPSPQLPLFE